MRPNISKRWQLLFHALPNRMPGKGRLARLLLGQKITAENVEIFDCFGNTYRVPNLAEPIAFWLFVNGIYEESTWIFLKENLCQGGVFLDIGANIGAFSIPAAGLVGKKGLVVSVEGSPVIASYLKHNIAKNLLSNVQLIESIVSAEENQKLAFYEAPSCKFGMGSMGPQFEMKPVMLTNTFATKQPFFLCESVQAWEFSQSAA